MSGELAAKVRLVRCPKCRQLLTEYPHFDVYKCGGCGTTLQAKKRISDSVNSKSSTHETDAALGDASKHDSDNKEFRNGEHLTPPQEIVLKAKATSSSSGVCSLDDKGEEDQNENGNCNGEQPVLPREIVLRPKATSSSSGECSMDEDGGKDQNENRNCNGEQPVLPQEIVPRAKATSSSSGECSLDEDGGSHQTENEAFCGEQLVLPQENVLREQRISPSSEECSSDEICAINENANWRCNGVQLQPSNLSDEDMENEMDTNKSSDIRDEQRSVSNKGTTTELTHCEIEASSAMAAENPVEETNDTNLQLAGAEELSDGNFLLEGEKEESICASDREDVNIDKSAPAAARSKLYITGSKATARSSSTDNFVSEKGSIAHVTPQPEEGSTSRNPISSNEQLKQAQKSVHRSFDRERSVNTFNTTEAINKSSEFSGTLGELSKSATTRSYHAYDGSISSYDGRDEWFPNHSNSSENTYGGANVVSEGRPRKGKGLVNSMTYQDHKSQQHSMNFSSDLPNGKHHVMKDSKGKQMKVPETTRHGRSIRHWMRTEAEVYPSRMAFRPSVSQPGYESGSPSNHMHDELYCSSSFVSPDSFEDPDQEKMKMLTMIYKLQDQLNRTNHLNGETNRRLSTSASYKEKHISAYNSHDFHEGRFHHDVDYSRYNGRCSHGINWPHQRHKFSRIPFSAEATSSTHHVDHSCFHCYPQERQFSTELPAHVLYQREELCRFHPGHSRCFSHHSYPYSPIRFMDSKLPLYGRETESEDLRHRAHELKKLFREKQNLAKRHFRPVAGGAPFVTCPNCLKLLQLPADFLLFKRVCNQLKCGACSEVLQYSLQNRSHIVSYAPNTTGITSSDQREVINGRNLPSASHVSHYQFSHAEPITYSDDYGLSAWKSCSSEGDPVSLTLPHPLHGSEHEPNVSHGAFEPSTEKEKSASRYFSSSKAPGEGYDSAGVSSKSPEMKENLPPRSSPLHQLMGYSSLSQVIRGPRPSDSEGYGLTLNRER